MAEQAIGFEHRDLHWGNVLVKEVKGDKQCEYKLDGDIFKVHTIKKWVVINQFCWELRICLMAICVQVESEETLATIIDFSLSRAEVELLLLGHQLTMMDQNHQNHKNHRNPNPILRWMAN